MSRIEFELPDVGEGVAEGVLLEWFVSPGDTVTEGQVVAEIETDKAVVNVPAPVDGTVAEQRADAGDIIPVGDVLVVFEVGDGDDGETTQPVDTGDIDEPTQATGGADASETTDADASNDGKSAGQVFAPPSVRRLARELGVDIAGIDGSGPSGRVTGGDVRRAAQGDGKSPATDESTGTLTAGESAEQSGPSGSDATASAGAQIVRQETDSTAMASAECDETFAMPATRALAHKLGIEIDDVPASGRVDGRPLVTEADVREYVGQSEAATEPQAQATTNGGTADAVTASSAGTALQVDTAEPGVGERVPYRGIRRTIGEQMQRAKFTAPHATHHERVDVTELVSVRSDLADVAEERGFRLTFTPFFLKAVVAGLREYPLLNSRLDEEAEEIVCYDQYHIGVAVDTNHGLLVPVIDNVDKKSIAELAAELTDLVQRAQDRSLERTEMQGSTFTITNAGNVGGEYATPIINYPEAAILGFAAIRKRPWIVDDEVVPRQVLPLSLSFDHRVVDGATGARFVNDVMEYLREPRRLLLD